MSLALHSKGAPPKSDRQSRERCGGDQSAFSTKPRQSRMLGWWCAQGQYSRCRFQPLSKYPFEPLQCRLLSLGADMRRREFIKFAICASLTDLRSANAQETSRVRRIGVLMGIGNDTEGQARLTALTEGLRNAGWIIGTNLQLDIRWGAADAQMTKVMAREILDGHPDVTLAANTVSVAMLLEEKSATPIVFVSVFDPIDAKFVSNLARPGGRITGFTNHERSMGGKWLQILKEIRRKAGRR